MESLRKDIELGLRVVNTPVALGLCWLPFTATRVGVYSDPGCRFLSGYCEAEGPTLYCLGWPPRVRPTVSRYPAIRARGGVQVTITLESVSFINWRLVGASNSRKQDKTHQEILNLSNYHTEILSLTAFAQVFLRLKQSMSKPRKQSAMKSLSTTEHSAKLCVSQEKLLTFFAWL